MGAEAPFDTIPPVAPARWDDSVRVELTGPIIQVNPNPGGRVMLGNGTVRPNNGPANVDTLVTGGNTGFPELSNTGVPFGFTDDGSGLLSAPRNNVRYFYAVTAFDVNSFASGPSSLESQRSARAVIPVRGASNVTNATLVSTVMDPAGTGLDPAATSTFAIDTGTGRFSGPPPSNVAAAVRGLFIPLVPSLLPSLDITATIDSIQPRGGDACGLEGNFHGHLLRVFHDLRPGGLRAGAPPDGRPLADLERIRRA